MLLLVVGIYVAIPSAEEENFPRALDEVEQYVKASNLEVAEQRLLHIVQYIDGGAVADQA